MAKVEEQFAGGSVINGPTKSSLLAEPGKSRGCSTNHNVIHW